jgi:hypothetical protein
LGEGFDPTFERELIRAPHRRRACPRQGRRTASGKPTLTHHQQQEATALHAAHDDSTVLTNVFTGRPARTFVNRIVREVGPLASGIPSFPLAQTAVAPLRTRAESEGSGDFGALYAGQAVALGRDLPAGELNLKLANEALDRLGSARFVTLPNRARSNSAGTSGSRRTKVAGPMP